MRNETNLLDQDADHSIVNGYVPVHQFRYTQHVEMRGSIKDDDMAVFIIHVSHCPCLISIDISAVAFHRCMSPSLQVT